MLDAKRHLPASSPLLRRASPHLSSRRRWFRISMSAVLVPCRIEEVDRQGRLLSYAINTAKTRVFLYLTGPLASEDPTPATLDQLTHCYDPVARLKPTFDVVPLFPSVGWTPERLAELPGVEELVAGADHLEDCNALLDQINAAREGLQLPSLSLTLTAGGSDAPPQQQQPQQQQLEGTADQQAGAAAAARQQTGAAGQHQQGEGQPGAPPQPQPAGAEADPPLPPVQSRVLGGFEGQLRFRKVAVGGTFDRLHAGHRLLLAATALVSTAYIFVGVTAQKLLQNKRGRELLETYDARAAAAVDYMTAVNPGVRVYSGPLNDPNEPPIAATDASFDAIVVSEETIPGAEAINAVRAQLGFPPLTVVVVGLIASHRRAAKLSSTDLRVLEAERAARQ